MQQASTDATGSIVGDGVPGGADIPKLAASAP